MVEGIVVQYCALKCAYLATPSVVTWFDPKISSCSILVQKVAMLFRQSSSIILNKTPHIISLCMTVTSNLIFLITQYFADRDGKGPVASLPYIFKLEFTWGTLK